MTIGELERMLASVPDAAPTPTPGAIGAIRAIDAIDAIDEELIASSVRYLASDAALRSVEADTYWPKWDSPWWHMLLLLELGEARRVPARIVRAMVDGLNALPLHVFPIHPEDSPPGTDPHRDSSCHCAMGCMHQALTACGVDVAAELPWIESWFPRYQMADGGASCDASAYLSGEHASSMVGTIAPFEAMLARPASDFADRAAGFLIERRLMHGSPTRHNAAEREAAEAWPLPCFPRFYFYDVLRGLAALVRWAELRDRSLPLAAIAGTVAHLVAAFPDGAIAVRRQAHAGKGTWLREGGAWVHRPVASTFPLLAEASALGRRSPALTRQWAEARRGLRALLAAGRITA